MTQKCQWSDVGETCDNEATQIVEINIGGATFRMPSCDECSDVDAGDL